MLADDLAELERLARSGSLTPAELAAARARVIQSFIAAPPAERAALPPAMLAGVVPPPQGVAAPRRVTGVPRYFGKIPPRMVPVALATGAGLAGGVAAGEVFDAATSAPTGDAAGSGIG